MEKENQIKTSTFAVFVFDVLEALVPNMRVDGSSGYIKVKVFCDKSLSPANDLGIVFSPWSDLLSSKLLCISTAIRDTEV